MTTRTRTFTRAQLDALGLPDECGAFEGAAEELHCEQVDTRRWESVHELVFRAPDDGRAYRVTYREPLTEMQESDPWNDAREVEAVEVEEYDRTVKAWRPVGEQPADDHPADGEQPRPHPPLTADDRAMLRHALDLTRDRMADRSSEYSDADETALDNLARLAEQQPAAPRILTDAEEARAYLAARDALTASGAQAGSIATETIITAALATVGILTTPPAPAPDTCPAMFADRAGDWHQCAEEPDHDPADGHSDGEWSWPDGQTHATPEDDEDDVEAQR